MPSRVVRGAARRRWLVVATLVAVLLAIPVALHALPARAVPISPDALAARIAASARQPYQGEAVVNGAVGLPSLPQFGDLIGLFDGETTLRTWYASPTRWRVDTIDTLGERDLYQVGDQQLIWDYGQKKLTTVYGLDEVGLRLPRADDLAPPNLARRLLSAVTPGADRRPLPARRIAGIDAAGLRLVPTDRTASAATTVSHVDIWADPATGLPLEVDVSAVGAARPVLTTRFMEVRMTAPPASAIMFGPVPPGVGIAATDNVDLLATLRRIGFGTLPDSLGGAPRRDALGALPGIGAFGTGFGEFVAATVPGRSGATMLRAAREAGGTDLTFAGGEGVIVATPLLSVLIVQSDVTRRIYVVAGAIPPDRLNGIASELMDFAGWGG